MLMSIYTMFTNTNISVSTAQIAPSTSVWPQILLMLRIVQPTEGCAMQYHCLLSIFLLAPIKLPTTVR